MKYTIFAICFCIIAFASNAQNTSLQQILTDYYNLKNALVKDDANTASTIAGKLLNDANAVDLKQLNPEEQKAFASVKDKITHNADHISEVNDIDHQREHFALLSIALTTLVQSVSVSQQSIYIDYCPMKKQYWLSSEKQIQNPYYGKGMPDCGNVSKTIMPAKEHFMEMNDKMNMNNSMSMNDTMSMNNNSTMSMSGMDMPIGNMSHSFSFNLPMSRNGSGTGWSPDVAPMNGQMYHSNKWMYMLHYNLFVRYNKQDLNNNGSHGDEMVDAPNWLMFMGQRQVGEKGLFRFGTMFSLDAVITGQKGYPLLFQSGESAHGIPLVDRQHPHDLFSELSVAYSYELSKKSDVFAYIGYPGEPALGPVAFMHRASGIDNPDAPISHHWIDATHITYGVATLGVRAGEFKLEGSSFTGREPNENRYNLDKPKFDSWSGRFSFNPSKNWALEISHAYIKSPEALHADENVNRTVASAEYALQLKNNHSFNATAIWGMNKQKNEDGENAALLEASYHLKKIAFYGKYEYVQKSTEELNLDETSYGNNLFNVNAYTIGLNYDILHVNKTIIAIGSHFTLYNEDKKLNSLYGKNPTAVEVYLRIYPGMMKM